MRWIDKLERRWGRYGIPNLMNIILVGQLIAWVIVMVINQNFYYAITLNRTSLMSGQIWRVVTFLFVPPLSTGIQLLLTLYFRWWVGNSLQRAWGDFRFMMYILVGMVGALVACLITGSAGYRKVRLDHLLSRESDERSSWSRCFGQVKESFSYCSILRALQKETSGKTKKRHPIAMAWGYSSVGRAPALQAGGQGFESLYLHHLG